jgi:hypothetical protein
MPRILVHLRKTIYQHSDLERQREVAAGLDQLVRARREAVDDQASGTDMARDA